MYFVVAWILFFQSENKTRTVLTGYLKPKESEEKRENSNAPPRWYRYNWCCHTSINRWENILTVTTLLCVSNHLSPAGSSMEWRPPISIPVVRRYSVLQQQLPDWHVSISSCYMQLQRKHKIFSFGNIIDDRPVYLHCYVLPEWPPAHPSHSDQLRLQPAPEGHTTLLSPWLHDIHQFSPE